MGQETAVRAARPLADALAALAAAGFACQLAMVDGQLVFPSAAPPDAWGEVRLRTPAGMITLRRRGGEVALSVFGNAGPELLEMRDQIAAALAG